MINAKLKRILRISLIVFTGNILCTNYQAEGSDVDEILYLYSVIHNEEDFDPTGRTAIDSTGNTGRADFDGDESVLKFTTGKYREIGKIFQKYGAKINLQSDWTFIDGVKNFDATFFKEWEAMGHENDPHVHTLSYPECYVRLKSAGANATGILGGTLEKNIQEKLAYFDLFYPTFYALWGAASFFHREGEEKTGYMWRPSKTGSWFQHDPDGKIIYIGGGGGWLPTINVEEVKDAYTRRKPNKVNVFCILYGTNIARILRNNELDNFDHLHEFFQEVDELKKTMKIEWKSINELVEIFRTREKAGTLDFSDIDVNNIPRGPLREPREREHRED